MEGNYFIDDATLHDMEMNRQVVFRYCTSEGRITAESNPNGSVSNIAGICNRHRNVLGMMPHPERASEAILGSEDGMIVFQSMVQSLAAV
jgi:phosphoribosylformylglycinamidine synthase